jgi:hypothetical protein
MLCNPFLCSSALLPFSNYFYMYVHCLMSLHCSATYQLAQRSWHYSALCSCSYTLFTTLHYVLCPCHCSAIYPFSQRSCPFALLYIHLPCYLIHSFAIVSIFYMYLLGYLSACSAIMALLCSMLLLLNLLHNFVTACVLSTCSCSIHLLSDLVHWLCFAHLHLYPLSL